MNSPLRYVRTHSGQGLTFASDLGLDLDSGLLLCLSVCLFFATAREYISQKKEYLT